MSRKWRNILIGVLIAVLVIGGVWFLNRGPLDFRDKYEGANLSAEVTGIGRSNTYTAYLEQYADLPAVSEAVEDWPTCMPETVRTTWRSSSTSSVGALHREETPSRTL